MGRDRTYFHVRRKGWWPGYRADITEWVKSCHHCQLVKPGPGKGKQRLKQERVGAPRERVAIDLIGPLPPSRRGKKYLVVMQDCFSKWVEVDVIATKKTTVVAQSFVNTWVTTFVCPRVLHQDNGLEFTGDVFVEVCSILGIDRTTTTPYSPQSKGTSGKSQPDVAEHVEVYLFGYWKRLGRSCTMGSSGLQSLSTRKHRPVSKQVDVRGRSRSAFGRGVRRES
jgi:hypothetical protein